jgi:hydrogenase nickel incorporation protein HypB
MCKECGCASRPHEHVHPHGRVSSETRTLTLHERLLDENDRVAVHNRESFEAAGVLVVNLLSSPGSGKTALLERTLSDLGTVLRCAVVVGDLQTDNDAQRLRRCGAPAAAVNTGTLCHLESGMVAEACKALDLRDLDVLFIENVGNLVCPAAFDLGEHLRVVVLSTTEGEDKPLKYPLAFKTANLVIVNKLDLAEPAGFNRALALDNIGRVTPEAHVLEVSARTGQGMREWYDYLRERVHARVKHLGSPPVAASLTVP